MHHSHHRPHANGRAPDYTALDVDDQFHDHQSPSRANFKKGKTWCVKDVCGIFCAVLTWFLILYAEFVVLKVILVSVNYLVASFFTTISYSENIFFSAPLHWNYLLHSKYSFISSNKYFGIFFSCENNAHRPWCSKYLIIICLSI